MVKAALKLSLFIVFCIPAYSQKSDEAPNNLKPKNYWGVSIIPLVTTKTKIDGDKNLYQLHSHPKFGAEWLIHYHLNFSKNYSLVFSVGKNVCGSGFLYKIPKDMFDPATVSDITPTKFASGGLQIGNYKVQAELLRRWQRNKAHNWNLSAGLSLLFSFTGGIGETGTLYVYPNGQSKQYLTRYEQNYNNGNPWFNFHVSGGQEWVLKSKDIFQVNLKVNFSPINPSTGTYLFTTGIQPDLSGNYRTSGSYIGISVGYILTGYIFTRANKKPK